MLIITTNIQFTARRFGRNENKNWTQPRFGKKAINIAKKLTTVKEHGKNGYFTVHIASKEYRIADIPAPFWV